MLAANLRKHNAKVWLINTGWAGGGYGVGSRIKLRYTRAIIDAIHAGALDKVATAEDPVFGLHVPTSCPNVPDELLIPRNAWADKDAYDRQANKVGALFRKNFQTYADRASEEIMAASPRGTDIEGLVVKQEG